MTKKPDVYDEIGTLIQQARKYVLEEFGKRCEHFARGCITCEAWVAYDLLFDNDNLIHDTKTHFRYPKDIPFEEWGDHECKHNAVVMRDDKRYCIDCGKQVLTKGEVGEYLSDKLDAWDTMSDKEKLKKILDDAEKTYPNSWATETKKDKEALSPCWSCGVLPKLIEKDEHYYYQCGICGAVNQPGDTHSEQEARIEWNPKNEGATEKWKKVRRTRRKNNGNFWKP